MSKRPGADLNGVGKVARADGVVKKAGPRLPMMMYKEGEPLRDLVAHYNAEGGPQAVEVRIPAHCLTSSNRQVRARQLWGSDVYTEDSDLVAVLMHCGYWYHTLSQAPPQVAEVRAVLRPQPPREHFPSTARNSIRSRAWAAPIQGCSYSVEKCWVVTRSGTTVDLAPNLDGIPAAAPTFTPSHMERMVTRSVGAGGRQRQLQEVTVLFNLVNEPWPKYNMTAVADKGLKPHEWTSARLHSQCLYMESLRDRYELSRVPPGGDDAEPAAAAAVGTSGGGEAGAPGGTAAAAGEEERYRFCRCRRPLPASKMRAVGVPLPAEEVVVLHDGLAWEEIQWGTHSVSMQGSVYTMARAQFVPMKAE